MQLRVYTKEASIAELFSKFRERFSASIDQRMATLQMQKPKMGSVSNAREIIYARRHNSFSFFCTVQWSAIFPTEQVTEQQSALFVKKLLAVAVSLKF